MFFLLVVVVGQSAIFNLFLAIFMANFEESSDEIREQEWSGTCNEYLPRLKKPFSPIGFKELFKCQQSIWEEVYRQWGVIQFCTGVILGIFMLLILITSSAPR